jgi:hypothetical protein
MIKKKVKFLGFENSIQERIIINNHEDLEEYTKFKNNRFKGALEDILRDKDYDAQDVMRKDESPEKRTIKLFHQNNDLITATQMGLTKIIMGMSKTLSSIKDTEQTMLVNEAGGYGVFREGIEFEYVSDDYFEPSYPNIKKGINSNVLVIENASTISKDLLILLEKESIINYNSITRLREIPMDVLKKELNILIMSGLKEIVFETQLTDHTQIEEMQRLLNSLPFLTIRILTAYPEKLPDTKHKVILYDYTMV